MAAKVLWGEAMRFGVDVPTCLAGMAYPIPSATADEVIRIAVEAEGLGDHEVADRYVSDNLIGTPQQVCAKVEAFNEAGLDGFYTTLFVAYTVDEMVKQMRLFARYVIPVFS